MSKSTNAVDIGGSIDVSPVELDKMRRRREIRQGLQQEFNRIYYNPYRLVYRVAWEDPAVNRFNAARYSYVEYWKPNWRSFLRWSSMTIIPMAVVFFIAHYNRSKKLLAFQNGQIRAEDRDYKVATIGYIGTHHYFS